MARERRFHDVPSRIGGLALLALVLQLCSAWFVDTAIKYNAKPLPDVIPPAAATALALGEPVWLSRALSVWLQTFDYQSGLSVAWRAMDYDRLTDWLDLQLQLDGENPFPLLAASHLYGRVADPAKVRHMIDYVRGAFGKDPAQRWRWMASAVITARHRLDNLPLAEELASELDALTKGTPLPTWARQMHIFLKADLGERDAAIALLVALIEGGEITRKEEIHFLQQRLQKLQQNVEKSTKNDE